MTLRCPVCGDELATQEELAYHDHELPEAWEASGAGFTCPTCGATFDSEEDLVAHEGRDHAPKRPVEEAGPRVRPRKRKQRGPARKWPRG